MGVPNFHQFMGVPNFHQFMGVPNFHQFMGVPNFHQFMGVPNFHQFMGVPNFHQFMGVLNFLVGAYDGKEGLAVFFQFALAYAADLQQLFRGGGEGICHFDQGGIVENYVGW